MAILSIMALYHWDDRIFEKMQLPDGMDRTALLAEILTECAELELIYPDWDTMHNAIGYWSRTMIDRWNKAWSALLLKYNPLWNVDANISERETRNLAHDEERKLSGSSKDNQTGNQESNSSDTLQVSAYNAGASDWQNREKRTGSEQIESSGETRRTYSDGENREGTDTGTIDRETRRTGNIGVTSSQQLIKEELELAEYNLYKIIVKQFKQRFCLLVY